MLSMLMEIDNLIQEKDKQIKLKEIKLNTLEYAVYNLERERTELQDTYNRKKNDLSIISSYSTGTRKR